MAMMTLAYAVFFHCPRCGKQIDVGESAEALTTESVKALSIRHGHQRLEGTCPECLTSVSVPMSTLQSRARN
jgi:endogenous inhibitor of DNA gyrase (YacG/DUF329 family)